MAITVVKTVPEDNSTGNYTDYSVFVQFSKQIEGSYLNSDFIKLYKTNETKSEFDSMVDLSFTQEDTTLEINPSVVLETNTFYLLIITGGGDGIRSIDGDYLDANVVLFYSTGESVGPVSDPTVDVNINTTGTRPAPSKDLFSSTGVNTPIILAGSIPANKSVGVIDLDRIILYYNDTIASGEIVPSNSYTLKMSQLPVDPDPFANNSIPVTVSPSDDSLIFSTSYAGEMQNMEFTLRLQPMAVKGITRKGRDPKERVVKFMGPLSPVYASPEQIIRRLVGYGIDSEDINFEYDIWKLILEVSVWVREIYADLVSSASIIMINRLTVCLVLKELLLRGSLFEGGIKLRQLLATKVEYEAMNWDKITSELDNCIKETTPEGRATILTTIKSGRALANTGRGRETKIYGISR